VLYDGSVTKQHVVLANRVQGRPTLADRGSDPKFMREAIDWANNCTPIRKDIPKVGAVITSSGTVLARGRRGSGQEGDNEHAEWNAFRSVPANRSSRVRRFIRRWSLVLKKFERGLWSHAQS
jgi:hypothetical protein